MLAGNLCVDVREFKASVSWDGLLSHSASFAITNYSAICGMSTPYFGVLLLLFVVSFVLFCQSIFGMVS